MPGANTASRAFLLNDQRRKHLSWLMCAQCMAQSTEGVQSLRHPKLRYMISMNLQSSATTFLFSMPSCLFSPCPFFLTLPSSKYVFLALALFSCTSPAQFLLCFPFHHITCFFLHPFITTCDFMLLISSLWFGCTHNACMYLANMYMYYAHFLYPVIRSVCMYLSFCTLICVFSINQIIS